MAQKKDISVTPEEIETWLAEMKAAKLAASAAAAARLLGLTTPGMGRLRKRGGDRRTALSMAALAHRLPAYGAAGATIDAEAQKAAIEAEASRVAKQRSYRKPKEAGK